MSLQKGVLIVLEGINGSGKTTIINRLKKHLAQIEVPANFYKFPDRSGAQGKKIDGYLKGTIKLNSKYDVLDMFAANRKAVKKCIVEDLEEGKVVICDRYFYSAIAYQIPSTVADPNTINLYSDIIGYFDKGMPLPTMTYLIDGDHLLKRGDQNRERFHCTGHKAKHIKDKLYHVIKHNTTQYSVLKNHTGKLDEIVNFIAYDISLMLN